MTRLPVPLLSLIVIAGFTMAQDSSKVEFEVASIKPSPEPDPVKGYVAGCNGGPESKNPVLFRCSNMNLPNLITRAYDIMNYQLSAPESMRDQRFDIAARVPEGATRDQLRLMIQHMLIERFKLAVHYESREMPKYYLTVAKGGSKLKASAEVPPINDNSPPRSGGPILDKDGYPVLGPGREGMAMVNHRARLFSPQSTMEQFAKQIGGQLRRPVTNATGLTGKYDISLFWVDDALRATAALTDGDPGPTMERAIQEQLGLRLELQKGPVDVLVVDHFEKSPTGN